MNMTTLQAKFLNAVAKEALVEGVNAVKPNGTGLAWDERISLIKSLFEKKVYKQAPHLVDKSSLWVYCVDVGNYEKELAVRVVLTTKLEEIRYKKGE